jgi:hypothetical protein
MVEDGRYIPGARAQWAMLGAALVLGWFSVRTALHKTLVYSAPQVAAQLPPADGESLAVMARQRVSGANGEIDDATRALVRQALTREPLLADPLALAGLDAASAQDLPRAERLMIAARDRDPRMPLVRFWLLDHFVRTGQYDRALDEVGPAIRLQPDAVTTVMMVLAALAGTREGNDALARKLAKRPFWETSFFQTAASNTSPDALLRLLSSMPSANRATDEQRAVFLSLINAGQGARAYETWRRFLPPAYRSRAVGIYDGSFGNWPGAAPFNWVLTNDNVGTTRMIRAGDLPQSTALAVRYFGSTSGVLAEQYVHVTPGPYTLSLAARSRSTGATGGRLSMELRCLRGGEALAALPLIPLTAQLQPFSMPVTVPAGCDMLRAQLVGSPGEIFSEIEAQVTGLALVRAD